MTPFLIADVADIPVRATNALERAGIGTVDALTQQCPWCLLREVRGLGLTGLDALAVYLAEHGLHMDPCDEHEGTVSE